MRFHFSLQLYSHKNQVENNKSVQFHRTLRTDLKLSQIHNYVSTHNSHNLSYN